MTKIGISTFIGGIGTGAVLLFLGIFLTAFETVGEAPRTTYLGQQLMDSVIPGTIIGAAVGMVFGIALAIFARMRE